MSSKPRRMQRFLIRKHISNNASYYQVFFHNISNKKKDAVQQVDSTKAKL